MAQEFDAAEEGAELVEVHGHLEVVAVGGQVGEEEGLE